MHFVCDSLDKSSHVYGSFFDFPRYTFSVRIAIKVCIGLLSGGNFNIQLSKSVFGQNEKATTFGIYTGRAARHAWRGRHSRPCWFICTSQSPISIDVRYRCVYSLHCDLLPAVMINCTLYAHEPSLHFNQYDPTGMQHHLNIL